MSPTEPAGRAAADSPAGLRFEAQVVRDAFRLDLSFAVEPGEVLAVLGPNGAGKSTLLRALAGLTPVSAGQVTLAGRPLDDSQSELFVEPADRSVGFVFQDYRLFPHLSVAENVAFAPRSAGQRRHDAHRAALGWLQRLGLSELADRRPAALSGGQAQRVALARALAGSPELLLLDEPLSALDARTRLEVQSELRRHLAEFTGPCLLVTHDPLEALVLADRLLVLEDGRAVQDGTPSEVARRPATDYVARLLGLNLYQGRADGDRVALADGGTFIVPDHGVHGEVLVAVRPSSVVVGTSRSQSTSARNTWGGTVNGLTLLSDRVRLDIQGPPDAAVDVSPAAVADLGLGPGSRVWLSLKATDLEVYPRPQSPA